MQRKRGGAGRGREGEDATTAGEYVPVRGQGMARAAGQQAS